MAARRKRKNKHPFSIWSGIRIGISILMMAVVVIYFTSFHKGHEIYERYSRYGVFQEVAVESQVPVSLENDGDIDYYNVFVNYEYDNQFYSGVFYKRINFKAYEEGDLIPVYINSCNPEELFVSVGRYVSCSRWLFPTVICFALAVYWVSGVIADCLFCKADLRQRGNGLTRSGVLRRYRKIKLRSLLKTSWMGLTGLGMILIGVNYHHARLPMLLFGIPLVLIAVPILIVLLVASSGLRAKHVRIDRDTLVSKQQSGKKWILRGEKGTYLTDDSVGRGIMEGEEFCSVRCRGKKMGISTQME